MHPSTGGCWQSPFGPLDWTPCFRENIVNGVLPATVVILSAIAFASHLLTDRAQRREEMARQVALLNPEASHFVLPSTEPEEEPSASVRVFRSENAVIIDEALAIKNSLVDTESDQRIWEQQALKSAIEVVFAVLLLALHLCGVFVSGSSEWERTGLLYWAFGTVICVYSVWTRHQLFVIKLCLAAVYFLAMLSNVRSLVIGTAAAERYTFMLSVTQLVVATLMLIPSLFFPLSTRPSRELRAVQTSMHHRNVFQELHTAIATPRVDPEAGDAPIPSFSSDKHAPPPPPEQHAPLLSRALFSFVTPTVWKHYWTPIELHTVPQLMPNDRSAAVVAKFRTHYDALASIPLWRRLLRFFAPQIARQLSWALGVAFFSLCPVFFLSRLLAFFTALRSADPPPMHMGVLYAVIMFFSFVCLSVCQSQALFTGRRVCIQSRAVLINEIVSKILRRGLYGGEDSRASDGQVTNLVSVDVFKVSEFASYIHFLLPEQPLICILSIAYLIWLLGYSALVGLLILVVVMPLQAYLSQLIIKVQERTLTVTDARLDLVGEVLACIKTVKFFAWEPPFERRMREARHRELRQLRMFYILNMFNEISYVGAPMLVTMATFGVHTTVFNKPLTAETAFTALAIFNTLRRPLADVPAMLVWLLNALVSLRRIDNYLNQPDTEKYEQLLGAPLSSDIGFDKASFVHKSGEEDARFTLADITCAFPPNALSMVVGPVGAGKTSLLLALLGELHRTSGSTRMPCSVSRSELEPDHVTGLTESAAYCSQSAWLLGTTVRENIIFGTPYEEERYRAVIHACALEQDLDTLEFHDETEVGEKGTALSGGQKARIALARALYSRARYVLIDDALSAVDAHTAQHLVEHALSGPLVKGRTIVLVTHAVSLVLPYAAYAVTLEGGKVTAAGDPRDLIKSGSLPSAPAPRSDATKSEPQTERWKNADERRARKATADKNAEKTHREKKSSELYALYLGSAAKTPLRAVLVWSMLLVLYISIRTTDIASGAWLRNWARSYDDQVVTSPISSFVVSAQSQLYAWLDDMHVTEDRTMYFLQVYSAIVVAFILITVVRDIIQIAASLSASTRLYEGMVASLLRAPPQFYDRTPIGRIMNRLSKDIQEVDQEMSPVLQMTLENLVSLVAVIAVICWATPGFLFLVGFVIAMYYAIGALYLASSRDLKRIESVQRSPLYTLVGETLAGTVSIRAYSDSERVLQQCLSLVDKANRAFLFLWYENRWLSIRVDCAGAFVTLCSALFLLYGHADAALAGFTLSYAVTLVEVVLWLVRLYSVVEINLNSVERVGEYLELESERQGGTAPPAHWPTDSGNIIVKDLAVRYGAEFPRALDGVSFEVRPGEKVGIVGRTGSGKSTLSLAFFRFLEAEAGSIEIDGINIADIPLDSLRRQLTIIPQDSQLFKGTVRSNLDPFGTVDDADMWFALERCQITGAIKSLDDTVEQGGTNFSAGQRQLLSLARGLLKLRNSRILILDESTANLDSESDALIQRTIREQMAPGATILTVAHRLKTIIDYDKILVLDRGHVLEFDSPARLLHDKTSSFYSLCERSGELDDLIAAANAHAHAHARAHEQ
ncbi:hypothetical protein MCUN1_000716 [Malassezia cuniculi]|uniref:ATP-dependent bile acid permease n=1 Tax=Malassezia cuniculi TaxID=948313 RepID=A0AAF0ERM5_9BASI|nr:hypothetical protein MCUN1_000716 [Malassezia cuniculi]